MHSSRKNYKYKLVAALSLAEANHEVDKDIFNIIAKNLALNASAKNVVEDVLLRMTSLTTDVVGHLNEYRNDLLVKFEEVLQPQDETLVDSVSSLYSLTSALLERYGLAMAALERISESGHEEAITRLTRSARETAQLAALVGKSPPQTRQPPKMYIGDRIAQFEKLTPIDENPNFAVVFPKTLEVCEGKGAHREGAGGTREEGHRRATSDMGSALPAVENRIEDKAEQSRSRSASHPATSTRRPSRSELLRNATNSPGETKLIGKETGKGKNAAEIQDTTKSSPARLKKTSPSPQRGRLPYVRRRERPTLPETDVEWRASRAILDDVDWNVLRRQLNRSDQLIVDEMSEEGLKDLVTSRRDTSKTRLRDQIREVLFRKR